MEIMKLVQVESLLKKKRDANKNIVLLEEHDFEKILT
jgi:hypothetical protein